MRGEDAETLAYGVLLSLAAVAGNDGRELVVADIQPFGHAARLRPCQFPPIAAGATVRARHAWRPLDVAPDTSQRLINFDWTDNGLRVPFLDQAAPGHAAEA